MSAKEIIESVLKELKMSPADFARAIGKDRPQIIYDIQKGKTKSISPALAEQIISVYPQFDRYWLITGDGSMMSKQYDTIRGEVSFVVPYLNEKLTKVPFVREDATASFVESLYGSLEFEEDYFGVMPEGDEDLLDGNHIVFQVHGDSMEPTIPHRSIFLARKIGEGQWENASGVVVIVYGKTLTIKRILKNSLFNDNKITLKADNPLHGQIDVYRSEIRGMWQAVRIISQKIM